MKKRVPLVLLSLVPAAAPLAAGPVVTAEPAGGMTVRVMPGGATFTFAPPAIQRIATNVAVPASWRPEWSPTAIWPGAWGFAPRYDDDGSLILGGLFRQLLPETVVVKDGDGRLCEAGRDYVLNVEWAQLAAVEGRLGAAGGGRLDVSGAVALQRIDLLQLRADGTPSVKRGVSRLVCPARPDPDPQCRALAGIHIAPWRRDGAWRVAREDILPVTRRSAVVPPIRPEAVSETLVRLRAGAPVTIAFVGDSLTLGAEAGPWWRDDSATFRGRVMRTLGGRFPQAALREIQAFKGGEGIDYAREALDAIVAPAKPHLIIIGIGINDAHAADGENPAVAVTDFAGRFDALLARAAATGAEVVIHTSMETNPFDANGDARRWPAYREAMLAAAARHGAGVADTFAAWQSQQACGVPPFSQLHNWINHPGAGGHALFADTILGFFPE